MNISRIGFSGNYFMGLANEKLAKKVSQGINEAEAERIKNNAGKKSVCNVEAENVGEKLLVRTNYIQFAKADYDAISAGIKHADEKHKLGLEELSAEENPHNMLDSAFLIEAATFGTLSARKPIVKMQSEGE